MIVVSNTTPLIGLAVVGQFQLLRELFHIVYIPRAVYNEAVVVGKAEGGARDSVVAADWLSVVSVNDRLAVEVLLDELDVGEAETIVLARELDADWVLMDEKKGRRKLSEMGVNKVGTAGLLLRAKEIGFLRELRPVLVELRAKGFSISQPVIDHVLREAGEG